jgi:hypothetical protein
LASTGLARAIIRDRAVSRNHRRRIRRKSLALVLLTTAPHRDHPPNRKEDTMSNNPNTQRVARVSTETKAAFKTTEFIAYIVILIAMFIASAVVDNGDDGQGFGASSVWLYATLLTIGYMISRGLAKSGSRENYDRDDHR